MTTKRPSLRDREAQGLSGIVRDQPPPQADAEPPRTASTPAKANPEPAQPAATATRNDAAGKPARRKPGPKPQADRPPTIRLGGYWQPGTFDTAKRGYLADLDTQPDSPGTFAGWIDRAIRHHAQLTPQKRQQIAARLGEEANEGRGNSRSFDVAADTVEAMEQAVAADRRHGRVTSRAGFIAEAARAAVAEARTRYGTELPAAPARLPNRPPR